MKKLTILSYGLFVILGLYMTVGGVTILGIAEKFGVNSSIIGYSFTGFSAGISFGVYINKFFLQKFSIKKSIFFAGTYIIVAVFFISSTKILLILFIAMFLLGLGIGSYMSSANYILVTLYDKERNSKINRGNFFFSVGAIVSPFTAGKLMEIGVRWENVYLIFLSFVVIILIYTYTIDCRDMKRTNANRVVKEGRLNNATLVLGIALFAYVLSEMVFNYWVVSYFIEKEGLKIGEASLILTVFWIFMAFGRFGYSLISDKIKLDNYLLITSGLSIIIFIGIYSLKSILYIYILSAILGIGFSGIYANILNYGIKISSGKEAKAMTYIVWWSSVGGIIAVYVSSFIKQNFGMAISFGTTGLFIALIFISVGISKYLYSKEV